MSVTWVVLSVAALAFVVLWALSRYYIRIAGDPITLRSDLMPSGELRECDRMVPLCTGILRDYGWPLVKTHIVLDFGCGGGRHTYEFRDAGFRAFGFDQKNYVSLREESDIQYFMFPEQADGCRIPRPDNTFDLIFSSSVLEHVTDHDAAFREMHRVLKPGGVSLHEFPSRWRLIEHHMYVPFGGRFQNYPYFLFWALMGIRNEFQTGKTWREVAELNWAFSRTGLCYLTKRQILSCARRHFERATFAEDIYLKHTRHASTVSRLVFIMTKALPFMVHVYAGFHTRLLILEKPS